MIAGDDDKLAKVMASRQIRAALSVNGLMAKPS